MDWATMVAWSGRKIATNAKLYIYLQAHDYVGEKQAARAWEEGTIDHAIVFEAE